MTDIPRRGYAFLVPSGPGEDQKHLYVLLTDVCEQGCHLAVPVQSVYPGEYHDSTCFLREGDHPFVTHLSWIAYHRATHLSHAGILEMMASFTYLIKARVSDTLLERIEAGLFASKRVSKKYREYYLANKKT